MPIKLIVADDHTLFRKGLLLLLQEFQDIQVIGEAENGKDLLEKLRSKQPDIILLDIDMPEMDGITFLEKWSSKKEDTKVLVISMHNENKQIINCIEAGANGYLTKDSDPDVIYKAILSVMENGYYFPKKVGPLLLQKISKQKEKKKQIVEVNGKYSDREISIVKLISEGFSSQEIAEKLFCSPRTVEGAKSEMMHRAEVKNTIGLVVYAIKNKLIEID